MTENIDVNVLNENCCKKEDDGNVSVLCHRTAWNPRVFILFHRFQPHFPGLVHKYLNVFNFRQSPSDVVTFPAGNRKTTLIFHNSGVASQFETMTFRETAVIPRKQKHFTSATRPTSASTEEPSWKPIRHVDRNPSRIIYRYVWRELSRREKSPGPMVFRIRCVRYPRVEQTG